MEETETALEELRRDMEAKHSQNRKDIHELRNGQQALQQQQHILELKLAPVIGIADKVDKINDTLQDMRVQQAENKGLRDMVESLATKIEAFGMSHVHHEGRWEGIWDIIKNLVPWLIAGLSIYAAAKGK
jgi:hypothetical protein